MVDVFNISKTINYITIMLQVKQHYHHTVIQILADTVVGLNSTGKNWEWKDKFLYFFHVCLCKAIFLWLEEDFPWKIAFCKLSCTVWLKNVLLNLLWVWYSFRMMAINPVSDPPPPPLTITMLKMQVAFESKTVGSWSVQTAYHQCKAYYSDMFSFSFTQS